MLYNLQFIPDHPVYRLNEAVGYFLEHGINRDRFNGDCYPDWFVPVVDAAPTLKKKFRKVFRKSSEVSQAVRDSIARVWRGNQDIQRLCESNRTRIQPWGFNNEKLCEALAELLDFLYEETLKKSVTFTEVVGGSLQHHYASFLALGQTVCPFCGLSDYVDAQSGSRSGYDHYLNRMYYPLAAVNFRNLVPMCDDCNEAPRKGIKDVLFADPQRTTRRKFFYPFGANAGISLVTTCTQQPAPGNLGNWGVRIRGKRASEQAQVTGWVSVFGINTRYPAKIRQGVERWVKDFLNSRQYPNKPTVSRLRRDFASKASWLAQPEQTRTLAQSALQAAAFHYLANRAPNPVITGWAEIAMSPAVRGIPAALN